MGYSNKNRYSSLETNRQELREFHRTQTEHNGAVNHIATLQTGDTLPEGKHTAASLDAWHRAQAAKHEKLVSNPSNLDDLDFTQRRPATAEKQNAMRGAIKHQGSSIANGVSVNRNSQPKPKATPNREGANPRSDAKAADDRRAESKPRKNGERTGSVDVSIVPR